MSVIDYVIDDLQGWCEASVFGTAPGELLISTEKLELPTVRNDLLNKQE